MPKAGHKLTCYQYRNKYEPSTFPLFIFSSPLASPATTLFPLGFWCRVAFSLTPCRYIACIFPPLTHVGWPSMYPGNNKEKQPFLPPSCHILNSSSCLHPEVSSVAPAHWKLMKCQSYHFTQDVISTDELSNPSSHMQFACCSTLSLPLSHSEVPHYYKTLFLQLFHAYVKVSIQNTC